MLCALALTGCQHSTPSGEPPVLLPPSEELTAPCNSPVDLPGGGLNAGQVYTLWGRDRASLVDCRDRQSGGVDYYAVRDAALSEGAP